MSSLSICLRLKVSIKSSALGEHWRALTFETEILQNPYIFFVTATLSKSYIIYKKNGKYCNYFGVENCKIIIIYSQLACTSYYYYITYNLLYFKMSRVLTLDDAVTSGSFVSWSADDFINDTSLVVSSDRWIF